MKLSCKHCGNPIHVDTTMRDLGVKNPFVHDTGYFGCYDDGTVAEPEVLVAS